MHSPVVLKIRCHNPNRHNSVVRNRNYLIYIATREGVMFQSGLEPDNAPNDIYVKYIAERPRSHGLFGNFDVTDVNVLANTLADYTRQGKNIFHGHVSLCEQDALETGYTDSQKWVYLLNSSMPDIAKEFHIPIDSFQWTAAVHMEPTHPHCHFMFWDTRDKVNSPFIHPSVQNRCRMHFSDFIFQEERENAILDKTAARDSILKLGKNILQDESDILRNLMPERIHSKEISSLSLNLLHLMNVLPHTGRLQYKLLTPEVKVQVDQVVNQLLQVRSLEKEYNDYLSINIQISNSYSADKQKQEITLAHADTDIRKRLGNAVLTSCKTLLSSRDKLASLSLNFQDNSAEQRDPDISTILPDDYPDPDISMVPPDSYSDLDNFEELYIENDMTLDFEQEHAAKTYTIQWSNKYKTALSHIYNDKPDFQSAWDLLSSEHAANNVLASLYLGKMCEYGYGRDKDIGQAGQYYASAFSGFHQLLSTASKKHSLKEYINYRLGKLYEAGQGTEADYEKAIQHYKAAGSNKYAQYSLGNMYLRGNGIEINAENKQDYFNKAMLLFRSSAKQYNPYAAYAYAYNSEISKSLSADEIKSYYSQAFSGFCTMNESQETDDLLYKIGTMYLQGKGIETDLTKALSFFEKSAGLGNLNASYALGKLFCDPSRPCYNLEKGISNLKEVSDSDSYLSSFAQYTLGKIYYEQKDLPHDIPKALHYYKLSAEQNNEHAQYALGKLYSDKTLSCHNLDTAISYFQASAEHGNSFAQYQLGKIYYQQVPPDIDKSIRYFQQAASQDNEHALFALGKLFSNQELGCYNIQAAISYLEQAAEKNNSYAEAALGNIYLWGSHAPTIAQNIDQAKYWLTRAIENGNEYAQQSLDLYKNFQNNTLYSAASNLIVRCFSSLVQKNQRNLLLSNKGFQSRSKENKKIQAQKFSEHSFEDH